MLSGDFGMDKELTVPNPKRIAKGLVAAIVILLLFDLLPSLVPDKYVAYQLFDHFYVWPGVGGLIAMFVAAFGGAYVSRVRFVAPAAVLAVAGWSFVIHILNSIAAAAGQGGVLFVASVNSLGLVFGIVGAMFGAILGERIAGRLSPATDQ